MKELKNGVELDNGIILKSGDKSLNEISKDTKLIMQYDKDKKIDVYVKMAENVQDTQMAYAKYTLNNGK